MSIGNKHSPCAGEIALQTYSRGMDKTDVGSPAKSFQRWKRKSCVTLDDDRSFYSSDWKNVNERSLSPSGSAFLLPWLEKRTPDTTGDGERSSKAAGALSSMWRSRLQQTDTKSTTQKDTQQTGPNTDGEHLGKIGTRFFFFFFQYCIYFIFLAYECDYLGRNAGL